LLNLTSAVIVAGHGCDRWYQIQRFSDRRFLPRRRDFRQGRYRIGVRACSADFARFRRPRHTPVSCSGAAVHILFSAA
jgi:hypothetical protein